MRKTTSRLFFSSIFSLLCLLSFLVPTLGHAEETAEELQANLNSLSEQIKALDAEIKAYNAQIGKTQGEAKTLKQALVSLENRRKALIKDIDYTKLRILRAQENITYTKTKIVATETVLERNKKALSEALRSLVQYEQNLPQFISALAPGAKISDALEITKRNKDASHAIDEKVRALMDVKTTLALQKAEFEKNKNILVNLNETLADQKEIVEQTSKSKTTLLAQTKNKETEYQKLLADRRKKRDALEIEMLDVESKLSVIVDVSKLPKYGKGVLKYPVDDVVITQYFGNTPFASQNPQVYNGSGHNGIDFGVRLGTPIRAALAGTVLGTGNTDTACSGVSYGKWVLIRHGNGLTTLYAHLSTIGVKSGDKVITGQQIGLSGSTGYSTGPHLHFTVYASDAVHISVPGEYKSKICNTDLIMPLAPRAGYLNPLSYL